MIDPPAPTSLLESDFEEVFENARVLVTGDCGFIGTHLCRSLLDLHALVYGVSLENHSPLEEATGVSHASLDLRDGTATKSFVERIRPDIVFHLAGLVNTSKNIELVLPTLEHNLLGSVNLLAALKESGICKIIMLTSSDASPWANTLRFSLCNLQISCRNVFEIIHGFVRRTGFDNPSIPLFWFASITNQIDSLPHFLCTAKC